ncbi:uncharacterized protein [Drosophila kikkawai]|uniref:Peptidase A2 domain-containing protein n=1 Tax=Drosophila kikkawai TaxID=30033 RepID=A0ABM4GHY2_DROKI
MPTGDEEQTPLIPAITLEGSQSVSPRPDQVKPKATTATPRAKGQEALDTAPSTSSRSTRSVAKMAQSALDIALRKFISTTDRVSHFEADINTPSAPETDSFSPAMCQVHRDKIRALWDKVEKSYESCSDLLSVSADSAATSAVLESKYSYCYSVYSRCVVLLQGIIDKAAAQSTPASAPMPTPPSMEKLFHLLSKTSGDAHAIVSKAPLTNEGFISAWQSLTDRFENRRLLVNSQLKILFNIQAVPQESGSALKDLQGTVQSCLTALEMSSIQIEAWDCLLVYMVSLKLPKITLSMWEQSIHNKAEIPTWNELDSFLTERHRTLEAIDDIRPSNSGQIPPRPTAASAPVRGLNSYEARVAPAPRGCDLCSRENHPIRLCPRFLEMDVDGRSDYIRRKQFCLNCFARGHQQRDCTSAHSCFTCRSRHHTLLHRDNPSATAPSPTAPPRPRSAPTPQGTSAAQDHTDVQVCFASGSRADLLGTALINICHLGRDFQARALIDSGSEATFITERLFRQISPPFTPVQSRVSGLNETVAAQSTKLCTLAIRAPSRPGLQLETAAYVLPQLAGKLPSYPIPRDLLKELPDVPLADPTFSESSEIDVLIGADILPSVLLGGSKNNIFGSLLAQETIFGWVLSGPVSSEATSGVSVFSTRISVQSNRSVDKFRPIRSAAVLESRRTQSAQSYRCRICNGFHPLRKCQQFLKLSAHKRLRAVLDNRYCSNCLAHEHSEGTCRSGDQCKTCNQHHHTLLHKHDHPGNSQPHVSTSTQRHSAGAQMYSRFQFLPMPSLQQDPSAQDPSPISPTSDVIAAPIRTANGSAPVASGGATVPERRCPASEVYCCSSDLVSTAIFSRSSALVRHSAAFCSRSSIPSSCTGLLQPE